MYLTKKIIEKTIFICINLNKEERYNRVRLDVVQAFLGSGTGISFTLTSLALSQLKYTWVCNHSYIMIS